MAGRATRGDARQRGTRGLKQWHPDRFGGRIPTIAADRGATIVPTGAPGDRGLVDTARAAIDPDRTVIDLTGHVDLLTLAAVLAHCAIPDRGRRHGPHAPGRRGRHTHRRRVRAVDALALRPTGAARACRAHRPPVRTLQPDRARPSAAAGTRPTVSTASACTARRLCNAARELARAGGGGARRRDDAMSLALRLRRGTAAIAGEAHRPARRRDVPQAAERGVEWIKAVRHLRWMATRSAIVSAIAASRSGGLPTCTSTSSTASRGGSPRSRCSTARSMPTPPRRSRSPGGDASLLHIGARVAASRGIAWRAAPPASWRERLKADARAAFLVYSPLMARSRAVVDRGPRPAAWRDRSIRPHRVLAPRRRRRRGRGGLPGPHPRRAGAGSGSEGLHLVGVGPRTNFRARRWWSGATETTTPGLPFTAIEQREARTCGSSLAVWRARRRHLAAMRASADLRAHAVVDGCDLWDLVGDDLRGVAWLQFPWSARVFDEALAASGMCCMLR